MYNNNQYAKTIFELSKNADCIARTQDQLMSIKYLFNKVPAFRLVLITKRLDATGALRKIIREDGSELTLTQLANKYKDAS